MAGGLLYGTADVATKALTALGHAGGLAAVVSSPLLAVLAGSTLGAFLSFQRGLQLGRALRVTTLMTAATNLVSIAGGLVVFGDPLVRTPLAAGADAVALGVVVLAATALTTVQARLTLRSPAARAEEAVAVGAPVIVGRD